MKSSVYLVVLTTLIALLSACKNDNNLTADAWYCYAETQCADPWSNGSGELETQVRAHLESEGIDVIDFMVTGDLGGRAVCQACTCVSGRQVEVLVAAEDLAKIESLDVYPNDGWTECLNEE